MLGNGQSAGDFNQDGLDDIEAWLGKVRSFWTQRLDKLEALLAEDGKQGDGND